MWGMPVYAVVANVGRHERAYVFRACDVDGRPWERHQRLPGIRARSRDHRGAEDEHDRGLRGEGLPGRCDALQSGRTLDRRTQRVPHALVSAPMCGCRHRGARLRRRSRLRSTARCRWLGQFKSATLLPIVRLEDLARSEEALLLHEKAHARCFIARSMNFPVHCEPRMLA